MSNRTHRRRRFYNQGKDGLPLWQLHNNILNLMLTKSDILRPECLLPVGSYLLLSYDTESCERSHILTLSWLGRFGLAVLCRFPLKLPCLADLILKAITPHIRVAKLDPFPSASESIFFLFLLLRRSSGLKIGELDGLLTPCSSASSPIPQLIYN